MSQTDPAIAASGGDGPLAALTGGYCVAFVVSAAFAAVAAVGVRARAHAPIHDAQALGSAGLAEAII